MARPTTKPEHAVEAEVEGFALDAGRMNRMLSEWPYLLLRGEHDLEGGTDG